MNDPKDDALADPHPFDGAQAAPVDGAPGETAPGESPESIFALIDKLNAENTELKDARLRILAEMENLRRRTEREVSDAKLYGVTNFARDMLTFADNLRRAVTSVPAEALANADPALKNFVEGIDLTERDFLSRLVRYGVKKLEPKGQKFDPNMHEALFEVPDPNVATGTVVQVVEDGYSIGERCLRPAKVGVARGGPKAVANGNGSGAAEA